MKLKKCVCLLLLIVAIAGCQQEMIYDKNWAADFSEKQVRSMEGYRLVASYFYQGDHIKVNDQSIGKGVVVKTVISYYDVFKDPLKHELVSVFDDSNIDLAGQGYIYGENEDILLGVDAIEVLDANQPIKYLKTMNEQEISALNQKLK